MHRYERREILRLTALLGVSPALAGCLGDDDAPADDSDDVPAGVPPRIHNYLRNARGYDRSIGDHRGETTVEVDVGAGDVGLAFAPPAIRVDVGTTVEWEWTGSGGVHDVAATGASDFSFQSPRTAEAGETFSYTFEDGGVALYECRPHRTQRMFGAIEVMFEEDTVDS